MKPTRQTHWSRLLLQPLEERALPSHTAFYVDAGQSPAPAEVHVSETPTPGHENGCNCGACQPLLDSAGRTYYALPPVRNPPQRPPAMGPLPYDGPFPADETFKLNSLPSATKTIYLDFDGHTTTGTSWNDEFGTIITPAFSFEGGASFSTAELERIQFIWQRVAEDMRPFNVNVTTEFPGIEQLRNTGGSDTRWGVRVVVGPNTWYENRGGVAYLGSFTWDSDTPCYAFSTALYNDEKNVAEVISHEVGHTLGLSHDGRTSPNEVYYEGHHGSGLVGWAPIMGASYYQDLTQWSRGQYPNANNTEDDLAIITNPNLTTGNGFTYRTDDVGNTPATARIMSPFASGDAYAVSGSGIIEQNTDVDVFSFSAATGPISLTVTSGSRDINLDVRAELLTQGGTVLATSAPNDSLHATLTYNITTGGAYFLRISGSGAGNLTTGYSNYGSLGSYKITGTVLRFDYGDAPDSYGTSPGQNGARHKPVGVMLGSQRDYEYTLNGTLNGTNDDETGTGPDDEDGVRQGLLRPGHTGQVRVTASGAGYLNAWFDWNRNGVFDSSERVATNWNVSAGANTLTFPVAANVALGGVYARFRVTTNAVGSPSPVGSQLSGEVEDYRFSVTDGTLNQNFDSTPTPGLPEGWTTINLTTPTWATAATGSFSAPNHMYLQGHSSSQTQILESPIFTYEPGTRLRFQQAYNTVANRDAAVLEVSIDQGDFVDIRAAGGSFLRGDYVGTFNFNTHFLDDRPAWYGNSNGYVETVVMLPPIANQSVQLRWRYEAYYSSTSEGWHLDDISLQPPTANTPPQLTQASTIANSVLEEAGMPVGAVGTRVGTLIDLVDGSGRDNVADPDVPAATGMAILGVDATLGTWYYSLNSGTTWVPLGVPTPAAARLLPADATTRLYFKPAPDVSGNIASLTFRAWDRTVGTTAGTLNIQDPTNANAVSASTATIIVPVTPVNDPPSVTGVSVLAVPMNFPTVTFNWAQTLSVGPPNEAGQTLSFNVSNNNTALFSVQPSVNSEGKLTLRPRTDRTGTAIVSITPIDDGGTSNGGQNTGATRTVTINVGINTAPVLASGTVVKMPPISSNPEPNPGTQISDFFPYDVYSDPDFLAETGVVLTGQTGTAFGTWEYRLRADTLWQPVGNVVANNGLLLSRFDYLRFAPNAGIERVTPTLTFRVWDRTTGTAGTRVNPASGGGTTAFSTTSGTIQIRVAGMALRTMEDQPSSNFSSNGQTATIIDADAKAKQGWAIIGTVGNVAGRWEYNTKGKWKPLPAVSITAGFLLPSSQRLRFVPMDNQYGNVAVQYYAWDQTRGTAGTQIDTTDSLWHGPAGALSATTDYDVVTVSAVNDAPVLDAKSGPSFTIAPTESDPAGTTVATLLGSTVTDNDLGTIPALAITAASRKGGTWEYRRPSAPWTALPTNLATTRALLLEPAAELRFRPDGTWTGTATLTYRAWDQSTGDAGTQANSKSGTAFSKAQATARVIVTTEALPPSNQAPVLDSSGEPTWTLLEDDRNFRFPVSDLLAGRVTDNDVNAAAGIALTHLDANGSWQYSFNGRQWRSVAAVSRERAFLLPDTAWLRFQPNTDWHGTAELLFRAWDQTSGQDGTWANLVLPNTTGTTTAFSAGTERVAFEVQPQNDLPVLAKQPVYLPSLFPTSPPAAGATVASLLAGVVSNVDPDAIHGIAVTKATSKRGRWQTSPDQGVTWNDLDTMASPAVYLFSNTTRVRYLPGFDSTGSRWETLTFYAWDERISGAGRASTIAGVSNVSRTSTTLRVWVGTDSFRPELPAKLTVSLPATTATPTTMPGVTVAELLGTTVLDPDPFAVTGIAVTKVDERQGTWEYSLDDGTTWLSLTGVTTKQARVLRATDRVRFAPSPTAAGRSTFQFRAWDESAAPLFPDTLQPTTTNLFSVRTATAEVLINQAPEIVGAF